MPTPNDIISIKRHGLTQTHAGALVHVSLRTWQRWEWGETTIPECKWELFQIKVSQTERGNHE